jgi:hypothetical protein
MIEYNLKDPSDKFELLQVNIHHDGSFKNAMLFTYTSMTKLYIEPILEQITIICNTRCITSPIIDKTGEELLKESIKLHQKFLSDYEFLSKNQKSIGKVTTSN